MKLVSMVSYLSSDINYKNNTVTQEDIRALQMAKGRHLVLNPHYDA